MGLWSLAGAASGGDRTSELAMTDLLRKLFHAKKLHKEESDTINVLVSLNALPDDLCLADLQEIGLTVKTLLGNKLTGEIASKHLSKLKEHANVTEVERSVKLKPTDDRACDP